MKTSKLAAIAVAALSVSVVGCTSEVRHEVDLSAIGSSSQAIYSYEDGVVEVGQAGHQEIVLSVGPPPPSGGTSAVAYEDQAICGLTYVTSGQIIGGVRTVRLTVGADGRFVVVVDNPDIPGVGYITVKWRCVRLKDLGDNPKFASSEFFEISATPGTFRSATLSVPLEGTAVNCYWAGFSGAFAVSSNGDPAQAFFSYSGKATKPDSITAQSVGGGDMNSYAYCVRTARNPVRRKWQYAPHLRPVSNRQWTSLGFSAQAGFCTLAGLQTLGSEGHELLTKLQEQVNPSSGELEWYHSSGPDLSIVNCQNFF